MQKAWLEARDWDELLPSHHQREWTEWFRELEDLEHVKIPRCLKDPSPKVEELSIHTFSGASENAYAAVVPIDLGTKPDSKRISTRRVMVEWARANFNIEP